MYNTLAELEPELEWLGCRVPLTKTRRFAFDGGKWGEVDGGDGWVTHVLERFGIPVCFSSKAGGVALLSGDADKKFTDDEMLEMLKGPVFIASDTAEHLISRGFGEHLGVDVREWKGKHPTVEKLLVNGNKCTPQVNIKELVPLSEKTEVYSEVLHTVDRVNYEYLFPGVTFYENKLGGVAVVFSGTPITEFTYLQAFSFLNESRKMQIVKILERCEQLPIYYASDEEVYLKAARMADGALFVCMFNIGLDFQILGGRLGGTIEYYHKKTSDLIFDYAVSTNRYPFGWMTANVGDITNKGIELSINAIPVKTKDFEWSTTLNLSHNKNTVDKLSNDTYSVDYINRANPNIGGFSSSNSVQRIMEGEPIGTFYMYEWTGYDENGISQFNEYDEEGNHIGTTINPGEKDRRKVGSAQPKLNLGWNNTINYKNWTLTAFFQGTFGNKIFNSTRAQYNNVTNIKVGKNGLKEIMYNQKGTDTNAQAPSDRYLENGSYLRLSSLSLGYNFGKIGNWVNSLKLTATCNNVFTITDYSGTDPEVSLGGLEPGIDWRNSFYPRTRTFMLGLNVNF